jgi:hypothetical protein
MAERSRRAGRLARSHWRTVLVEGGQAAKGRKLEIGKERKI